MSQSYTFVVCQNTRTVALIELTEDVMHEKINRAYSTCMPSLALSALRPDKTLIITYN